MQSTNFFNVQTISRTGESIYKENVHYKVIKDGNGVEYKVVNFDNPEICERDGIIELHPLKVTSRHENKVGFKIVTDRVSGIIYGIPNGVNPQTKQLEFLKINLTDSETLDLSVPLDAMKWVVIKNSFFLEGSPNLTGKPKYKVIDKEREARLFAQTRVTKRKAVDIAENLVGADLEDMARNLGIPPEANSPATLYMEVIKRAENDPKKFMEIWDSPTRKELTIFKRGVAAGIISDDPILGWNYNGAPLGPNEAMAIEYLREFPQTCQTIDLLTQKVEGDSQRAMASNVKSNKVIDEKDAMIARLQAEADAAKELLKKLAADKIVEEGNKEMTERDIWIAEGKRLDIKGIHMNKDLEKIKERVLEVNPDFKG